MTVPTNNEEAEAPNLLKYAVGLDHPTFGQGFFFTQDAVDSLISDVRRLPVSGDNAEARNQWNDAVQSERQRQRDKGYDAEHDRKRGVDHLLMEAQEYAHRGESVESAALVEAARELLASQPREVEVTVHRRQALAAVLVSNGIKPHDPSYYRLIDALAALGGGK